MEGLVHLLDVITNEDYDPTVVACEQAEEIERLLRESKLDKVLEEV